MVNGGAHVGGGNGDGGSHPSGVLRTEVVKIPGAVLVRILDDLDLATRGRVEAVVSDAAGNGILTVVDVRACFVDMAGVRDLIAATEAARRAGRTVVVVGLPTVWEKVLLSLGLAARLQRRPDLATAIDDYGRRTGDGQDA